MAAPKEDKIRVYYLSEQALTVEFGHEISDGHLAQVHGLNKLLAQNPFDGLISTIPAYATLSVVFDPVRVILNDALSGDDCFEKVSNHIRALIEKITIDNNTDNDIIKVPVCYGGNYGPDITDVAELNKLTTDEVIALHVQQTYKVGMIGFLPGFAYLMGLSDKLTTPRRQSPRKSVPAGSVGIAGTQTGIYSLDTPGGWQIIGRTPLTMFDAHRQPTTLLKSGDQVLFKAISVEEFEDIANSHYADKHY